MSTLLGRTCFQFLYYVRSHTAASSDSAVPLVITEYVVSVSKERGLNVVHYEELDGFRYEHGIEVRGHMFVLQKKQEAATDEL